MKTHLKGLHKIVLKHATSPHSNHNSKKRYNIFPSKVKTYHDFVVMGFRAEFDYIKKDYEN